MIDPKALIVIGGGEHARVVIETARSCPKQWNVLGFCDPRACGETSRRLGIRRLGDDRECAPFYNSACFIVGVGEVGVCKERRRVVERWQALDVAWATVVHASAWVSPSASLGVGVVVCAGAVINSGARLADHVIVNSGAVIEHDVDLGAFVQVAPGAIVGGGTRVGADSYLGLGSALRDHIQLGRAALVGMGAVVVRAVPDGASVAGVPAVSFHPHRRE